MNTALLRKTLEHLTAHPEEHYQSAWAIRTPCGSAFCLAGHAVQLAGHEIDWESGYDDSTGYVKKGSSRFDRPISDVAREELDLAYHQANDLFHGNNTLKQLWTKANYHSQGEIEIPEQFL